MVAVGGLAPFPDLFKRFPIVIDTVQESKFSFMNSPVHNHDALVAGTNHVDVDEETHLMQCYCAALHKKCRAHQARLLAPEKKKDCPVTWRIVFVKSQKVQQHAHATGIVIGTWKISLLSH